MRRGRNSGLRMHRFLHRLFSMIRAASAYALHRDMVLEFACRSIHMPETLEHVPMGEMLTDGAQRTS